MILPPSPPVPAPAAPDTLSKLRTQARALEAAFLSEMLAHAGLGGAEGSFAGGPGEEQFQSLLRQAQAEKMVSRGGIGLAEQIFNQLKGRVDET